MIYYLWPHIVYHLVRWFERNNRRKIQVVLWILSVGLIAPHFYILGVPQSSRYCDQPLLDMVVVSVIFSFLMFGFVVLLSLMEPLPTELRWAFHVFGLVCLVEGIVHSVMTWKSVTCETTVETLYFWSLALAVVITISTGIFVLLVPFWLLNHLRGQSVLNQSEKSGVCYQPTMCCSCLWHV